MERERRRDGGKEREEGESIRVRIAYVVKRIWADYCSGCSGPVCPKWEWGAGHYWGAGGERRRREVRRAGEGGGLRVMFD